MKTVVLYGRAALAVACLLAVFAPGSALAASAVTGSATDITGAKATLSSQVTLDGGTDRCYFLVKKETKQAVDQTTPVPCSSGPFSQTADLDSVGNYTFRAAVCESRGTTNQCPFGPSALGAFVAFQAPGPTATMGAAIPSGGTEATVTATVDGRGNPGVRTFVQYSLDPTFQTFQEQLAGPAPTINSPPTTISAKLTNLTPGTTYYARVRVFVEAGDPQDFYSSDVRAFRTGRYAQTLPATNVTPTSATLSGELNAADVSLSYRWFYGTDRAAVTAGTSPSTPAQTTAPSDTTVAVSAPVTGLTSGTTYFVRIQATYIDPSSKQVKSIDGEVIGFGTQAVTCPAGQVRLVQTTLPGTKLVASGCFAGSQTQISAPFVGYGTVLLNGLTFTPAVSTGTLRLDPAKKSMTTSRPTSIALGTTTLRAAGTSVFSTTWSGPDDQFTIGGLDLSSKLLGFPLGGSLTATPAQTGARLVVSALGLPNQLGGITAEATVDVDGAGVPRAATAAVGGSMIGPILLPSLTLVWKEGRTWEATADIRIPLLEQGVGAMVTITDNKLVGLAMSFASPVGVPLGSSGVTIDFIGASAEFQPPGFTFGGMIGGAAGPSIGGLSILRLDAEFAAAVAREATIPAGLGSVGLAEGTKLGVVPFAFNVNGTFKLLNVLPIASADFYYWGTPKGPLVALKGNLGFDFNVGSCGELSDEPAFQLKFGAFVGVAANKQDFNISAGGSGKVRFVCATILDLGVKFGASKKGMGVCGYVKTAFGRAAGGVGATWPSRPVTPQKLLKNIKPFVGCDLSAYTSNLTAGIAAAAGDRTAPAYTSNLTAGIAAAAAGDRTVRLPGGLPSAVLRVEGRGGPPRVVVTAPDGRVARVDADGSTVDRQKGIVVLADTRDGRNETYLQFVRPRAGAYRVAVAPGSPRITRISTARQLAPARVKAVVGGRGAVRTLRWNATGVAGQRLVFRERGPGGDRIVVSTRKARGILRFRPAIGNGGRRRIVVDVFNQGFARTTLRPATFSVSGPARPSRVSRLRLVRKGSNVRISWRAKGVSIDRYEVAVELGDGRRLLKFPRGRTSVIPNAGSGVALTATVRGVDVLGNRGPRVTGKLAG